MKLFNINPQTLSHELRRETSPHLKRRRRLLGLALTVIGSMGVIALYQMGIIKHMPEPAWPYLDADKVDASEEAYARLATPDAVLGMASYAMTSVLIAMGGKDRARTHPWIPLLMAAKIGFDAMQAGKLTVDQWTVHRAFCSWCLLSAGATFAQVPLAVPEARDAWRQMRRK